MSEALQVMSVLHSAEERHYLVNGAYTSNPEDLDVDFPKTHVSGGASSSYELPSGVWFYLWAGAKPYVKGSCWCLSVYVPFKGTHIILYDRMGKGYPRYCTSRDGQKQSASACLLLGGKQVSCSSIDPCNMSGSAYCYTIP
jgi:hypothetical protein